MSIVNVEKSLIKYHLLHFLIGAIIAATLSALPKVFGVLFVIALASMLLPPVVLPEFTQNKWFDRIATVLGGLAVVLLFYFFHKL